MMPFLLYVVDDEDTAREGIALALQDKYKVQTFACAEDALEAMPRHSPDLVLLDVGLPGMNGIEALKRMKSFRPETLVIMITAFEDVQTVVAAMKLGAYDYMVKPLDMNGLLITVRNALEKIALEQELQLFQQKYIEKNTPPFIGSSPAVTSIMEVVAKVAQSADTPVLIVGETGTGKELIAQTIHYRSPNFKGALVAVNCAAIPKDLIESELFGYERGAFSGADQAGKMGLVEKAAEGTLFLDEVGDMSTETQAKLLRFLESGEFFRIGGTRKHHVRTRVISATNKDLQMLAQDGRFRDDLYYRLAVVKIEVPPLRQRPEDIEAIAGYFLFEYNRKFGKTFIGIEPPALQALKQHAWIGNVRELKNLLERAILLNNGRLLSLTHLCLSDDEDDRIAVRDAARPELPILSAQGVDLPWILEAIESAYYAQAIELTGGNASQAARLLNISRDQFRYRRQKATRSPESGQKF